MKKVLVISTYFSADASMGSVRVRSLCRYLPEYGWEPVVLSPKIEGEPAIPRDKIKIIEYPDKYRFFRKQIIGEKVPKAIEARKTFKQALWDRIGPFIKYFIIPDPSVFWLKPAVRALLEVKKEEGLEFDAIFSSSNPRAPHFIAHTLKKKLRIPWVAEYRDFWTTDHYYPYRGIRRFMEKLLEEKIMGSADAITSISKPYTEILHAFVKKPSAHTISLGFDPAEWAEKGTTLTEKFSITYTGGLIDGKRDPTPLFQAVLELINEKLMTKEDIEIRFYGKTDEWLHKKIAEYGLEDIARQYGYVPREEALKHQRESQLLLILLWDHPLEEGVLTGKLEYLASQRPVMVIGGPKKSVWQDLIKETNVGVYLRELPEIKSYLKASYLEWKSSGSVQFSGNKDALLRYSYKNLAGELASILNGLSSDPSITKL